jgi:hypothetical protein
MPCIFCIAAIAVIAATIVPALIDSMTDQLRTSSKDLRKVVDTEETVMWSGTFNFTAADRRPKAARANVTVYKGSKRVRIQAATHDISGDDSVALEDAIARLLGATIVSRHDGRERALPAAALDAEKAETTNESVGGTTKIDDERSSSLRSPTV